MRTSRALFLALIGAVALPGVAFAGDDDARTQATRRTGTVAGVRAQTEARTPQASTETTERKALTQREELGRRGDHDHGRSSHDRGHDRGRDDVRRGHDDTHRGHDRYRDSHDYGHRHRPRAGERHRFGYREVWVEGYYERREVKKWVPGYFRERVIPAVVEFRYAPRLGRDIRVVVKPERRVRDWIPGRYDTIVQRVYVPGYWKRIGRIRGHRHHHHDHHFDFRIRF